MLQLHQKIARLLELKKTELQQKKQTTVVKSLLDAATAMKMPPSFSSAIKQANKITLICEYKRSSPSEGEINGARLEEVISKYEKGGADAVSILTEPNYFSGTIVDLKKASELTSLPLLRKDFVIEEYEIIEARANGASAVLLIAEITPNMQRMISVCKDLQMDALVECFTEENITLAVDSGASIIGVNNRSFVDLSVDKNRALALKQFIPKNCISIAESGVKNSTGVQMYKKAGFDSILIGTSLMKAAVPEKLLAELVQAAGAKI
ncbi:MAG: indole-3-glycerol-phosphate synthase [Candidatus Micrarchaeota archaeon]|nr:indole-3-glycerol-phosphate synthase [Candidatus Micrarchaeota archaeon]